MYSMVTIVNNMVFYTWKLPSNAGDTGSLPSRGTKIPHATGKFLHAVTKTWHSQMNFLFLNLRHSQHKH